ncbi:MAG TPA: hypothetical protein V6C65_23690 [Allocoleopsis sp.]
MTTPLPLTPLWQWHKTGCVYNLKRSTHGCQEENTLFLIKQQAKGLYEAYSNDETVSNPLLESVFQQHTLSSHHLLAWEQKRPRGYEHRCFTR